MKQVVNAIIIRNSALLMAKHSESGLFVLPGGKVEEGESTREALVRELSEELPKFQPIGLRYFHTIGGTTPSSKEEKEFLFYLVEGDGSVEPGAEVSEVFWCNNQGEVKTTEPTAKILMMLKRDGLI
jgi:8-oxo-dGTP diphosphatase